MALLDDKIKRYVDMAKSLMKQHDLDDWKLKVDKAKTRSGCCNHTEKHISLSVFYMASASDDEVKNTILHEIAHALAGPNEHHGDKWKAIALSIGCNGERCINRSFSTGRFRYTCPCGKGDVCRHRRTRRKVVCVHCKQSLTLSSIN